MTQQFKAILFDKDGTLIDVNKTSAIYVQRLVKALGRASPRCESELMQSLGYDRKSRELKPGSIVIAGSAYEISTAIRAVRLDLSHEEVDSLARQELHDLPVQPLGDILGLLKKLSEKGYYLGVATNDYEAAARSQLASLGVLEILDFVCGSDSGFGQKPDPGMVDAFISHVNCAASEVVMVGDSVHDVLLGRSAKCGLVVGVATGYTTQDELQAEGALTINSLSDLLCKMTGD